MCVRAHETEGTRKRRGEEERKRKRQQSKQCYRGGAGLSEPLPSACRGVWLTAAAAVYAAAQSRSRRCRHRQAGRQRDGQMDPSATCREEQLPLDSGSQTWSQRQLKEGGRGGGGRDQRGHPLAEEWKLVCSDWTSRWTCHSLQSDSFKAIVQLRAACTNEHFLKKVNMWQKRT